MKVFSEIVIINKVQIDFRANGLILHISKIEDKDFGFALYSGKEYVAYLSKRGVNQKQVEIIKEFMKGEV